MSMLRKVYFERLEKFKKLVQAHDLTYSFSDDHRVWLSGEASWRAIDEAAKGLKPEDAARVWNEKVASVLGEDEMYLMTAEQWEKRTNA